MSNQNDQRGPAGPLVGDPQINVQVGNHPRHQGHAAPQQPQSPQYQAPPVVNAVQQMSPAQIAPQHSQNGRPSTANQLRAQAMLGPVFDFKALPGSKTVDLAFPVDWHGASITEITLRRPQGRDMRALPTSDDSGVEDMFPFFALLSGMEDEFIDELDSNDISSITEFIRDCSVGDLGKVPDKIRAAGKREIAVALKYPIMYEGRPYNSLTLRRPKGKDMRHLPNNNDMGAAGMFPFYARLTEVDNGLFDELDMGDIRKVGAVAEAFLQKPKSKVRLSR